MTGREKAGDRLFQNRWMEEMRAFVPRVHCMTNYVTAQSVANVILAAGGSPIMASGLFEAEDVTGICNSLVINIGTLDDRTIPAMIKAGREAARLGHPVIFDPVGVGASRFRKGAAVRILREVPVALIRGNGSEIRVLLETLTELGERETTAGACGIDAQKEDMAGWSNAEEKAATAGRLARLCGCIVAQTGETDIVTDGENTFYIGNGHPWMAKITGSGCMLDGFLGAVLGTGTAEAECGEKHLLEAAVWAVCAFGVCGEQAYDRCLADGGGPGSFLIHLIDAVGLLTDQKIKEKARVFSSGEDERRDRISRALCLYAVTDRRYSDSLKDFVDSIEEAIKGGATMVQLREKELPREEVLREARAVRALTDRYGIPLIIDDDLETALQCGADGLHVGQEDIPAAQARKVLGPQKILGVTAKTEEQAKAALEAGADYLGSGAVFGSTTKVDAKAMDYETLKKICGSADIPVVAIGGITAKNVELLAGSGIAGAAVVSGIFGEKYVRQAAAELKGKILKMRGDSE